MSKDYVSYRELVKEIRTLQAQMEEGFKSLEACVKTKVSTENFNDTANEVKKNTSYRVKSSAVIGVLSAVIALVGKELWDKLLGR